MHTTRPVFLDLRLIRLPITGVVSILHRISGLLMVLAVPAAAALFHRALSGPEGFAAVRDLLAAWPMQLLLAILLWSLLHHLFAGIRYLLLDMGHGLERSQARRSTWIVLGATLTVLAVLLFILFIGRLLA